MIRNAVWSDLLRLPNNLIRRTPCVMPTSRFGQETRTVPNQQQWPPRSPGEALLSTPSGREHLRRLAQNLSPSTTHAAPNHDRGLYSRSPLTLSSLACALDYGNRKNLTVESDDDGSDDDDEETLQLKLQEIQARLRLKRLRNAKIRSGQALAAAVDAATLTATTNPSQKAPDIVPPPSPNRHTAIPSGTIKSAVSMTAVDRGTSVVEVPASPVHRPTPAAIPRQSPKRVLLGIDKGLKAQDVSLKRAPSLVKALQDRKLKSGLANLPPPPTTSFNEGLAQARKREAALCGARQRAQAVRVSSFGLDQQAMETYLQNAVDIPNVPDPPREFSRAEILGDLDQSCFVPKAGADPAPISTEQSAALESYSSLYLSRRIIPHVALTSHLDGKKVMLISDLLREVRAPDFSLPNVEQDIVVLAIVAKKSEPRSHKPQSSGAKGDSALAASTRGKYMVLTLVDLQHEVELYLFDAGFERYWRLTEGAVLALLNPSVMPPPPGRTDTGRFSLVVNSDVEALLEIGVARDLGWCSSIRRDGARCPNWVNARRTEHCEFHANAAVSRQAAARVELNGPGFGFRGRRGRGGSRGGGRGSGRGDDPPPRGDHSSTTNFDRETGTHWFVSRSQSAAELLDETTAGLAGRRDREQALRRKLADKERERAMAKKLAIVGSGAGREYMIAAAASAASAASSISCPASSLVPTAAGLPDARALGIIRPRDQQPTVELGPVKRKRPDAAAASTLGWGGDLREKLTRMRDGEKLSAEPSKEPLLGAKRARLSTERQPRKSDGVNVDLSCGKRVNHSHDSDDDYELIIIR